MRGCPPATTSPELSDRQLAVLAGAVVDTLRPVLDTICPDVQKTLAPLQAAANKVGQTAERAAKTAAATHDQVVNRTLCT